MSTLGKVVLVFVLLSTLGMFYLSAQTLRLHKTHREKALEYKVQIAKKQEAKEKTLAALVLERRKLNAVTVNRGRVWDGCTIVQKNAGELVVQVPDAEMPHGLTDKNVMYIFQQAPPDVEVQGIHVAGRPLYYLGEFLVVGAAADNPQIRLQPSERFTTEQQQRLTQAVGAVALCEKMPVDLHFVWERIRQEDADNLPQYFAAPVGPETIQQYARHGQPANDMDPEDQVMLKVRFTKDYVELTAAQKQEATRLNFRVVPLRMPSGDQVVDDQGNPINIQIQDVIQKDREAYFMERSPDGQVGAGQWLVDQGIAQREARLYARPLNDYQLAFRTNHLDFPRILRQITETVALIRQKQEQIGILDAKQQVADAEKTLLVTEQGRVDGELKVATTERDELKDGRDKYVAASDARKKSNTAMAKQLRDAQLSQAREINRKARLDTSAKAPGEN